MFTRRVLLTACLLGWVSGCGDNRGLVQVTGTVWYNNKPLANAYVGYMPEEPGVRAPSATTDSNGFYRLSTCGLSDGAKPGKYKVMVRAEEASEGPKLATDDINAKRGKLLTPRRYTNPENSGLTAEVLAGQKNVFDFKLTD